jgi:hypothetical protein
MVRAPWRSKNEAVEKSRKVHGQVQEGPSARKEFILRAGLVMGVAMAMALVAGAAQAAKPPTTERVASCSWERPGHDSYRGTAEEALGRYTDIAPEARARLLARMAAHDYDDVVSIRRDAIEGTHAYDPRITDMHFGRATLCHEVHREAWTETMQERALVYCDNGVCVMTPTVCRNVSRITRLPPRVVITLPEPVELDFEPPGAVVPALADPEPEPDPLEHGGPTGQGPGHPWPLPVPPWIVVGTGPTLPADPVMPSVPEPPSAALLGLGVVLLGLVRLARGRRDVEQHRAE